MGKTATFLLTVVLATEMSVVGRAEPASGNRLIAVLPLDVTHAGKKLNPDGQAALEEMLRDVATDALSPAGWTVLTGETTIQILRDNGVDPAKCGLQECHLSAARELNAQKFLSGSVQYVEGTFMASIRLIDTATGRILATESVEGDTVKALRKDFKAKANDFFTKGEMLSGGAR